MTAGHHVFPILSAGVESRSDRQAAQDRTESRLLKGQASEFVGSPDLDEWEAVCLASAGRSYPGVCCHALGVILRPIAGGNNLPAAREPERRAMSYLRGRVQQLPHGHKQVGCQVPELRSRTLDGEVVTCEKRISLARPAEVVRGGSRWSWSKERAEDGGWAWRAAQNSLYQRDSPMGVLGGHASLSWPSWREETSPGRPQTSPHVRRQLRQANNV